MMITKELRSAQLKTEVVFEISRIYSKDYPFV